LMASDPSTPLRVELSLPKVDEVVGQEILVPASTSNFGAGFDALGLALRLYLRIRIVGVDFDRPNTLDCHFVTPSPPGDNLIAKGFDWLRAATGEDTPGVFVEVRSAVPPRSGLGSSAAAYVGGLRLYQVIREKTDTQELLNAANTLEGHPDNASAAVLGGFTSSAVSESGEVFSVSTAWPARVKIIVATPEYEVATVKARAVLPQAVSRADAVFNIQRAALLVRALEAGDWSAAREALKDRLHQPHRASLVPGLAAGLALTHPSLIGVFLSGAGPSLVALAHGDEEKIMALLEGVFREGDVRCAIRLVEAHQPNQKVADRM
jgi:homoserine kinase